MISVFISYASEDRSTADIIFDLLKSSGYRPWMDKRNLIPGQRWNKAIIDGLKKSDVVIFILSKNLIGKRGFFQREMKLALEKAKEMLSDDIFIIPVLLDDSKCPDELSEYQWLDFTDARAKNSLLTSLFTASEQRGLSQLHSFESNTPIIKSIAQFKEVAPSGDFEISYELPEVFFPNDPSLSQAINHILSGDINKSVFSFRSSARDLKTEYSGSPSTLHMDIYPTLVRPEIFSFVRETHTYWNGAAHGNSSRTTMNINTQEKSVFSFSELLDQQRLIEDYVFKKIVSYEVTTLSNDNEYRPKPIATEKQIYEAINGSLVDGASFGVDCITLHFDPYEVHCFAFGPFSVDVSYSMLLKDFYSELSPHGRNFIRAIA